MGFHGMARRFSRVNQELAFTRWLTHVRWDFIERVWLLAGHLNETQVPRQGVHQMP